MLGSLLTLAACTTANDAPGGGDAVDVSSLYGSTLPSVKNSELQPVLSDDDSMPQGETGELVPGVYALLGEPSAEQKLVIDRALYLKVKTCMKDQGFTLLDPPPRLKDPKQPPILFDGYIGILDAGYAKSHGYQLNMNSIEQAYRYDIGKNQTYPNKEYEYALKVAGDGGCLAQAEQTLNQGRPSEDQSTPLLGKIYQDSLKATYADADYKQAVDRWSSCMKKAGYDYATRRLRRIRRIPSHSRCPHQDGRGQR